MDSKASSPHRRDMAEKKAAPASAVPMAQLMENLVGDLPDEFDGVTDEEDEADDEVDIKIMTSGAMANREAINSAELFMQEQLNHAMMRSDMKGLLGSDEEDGDMDESDEEDDENTDDQDDILNETIAERIYALKDMVSARNRLRIVNATSNSVGLLGGLLTFAGRAAWVVTTSALLLVLPLAIEAEKEQALVNFEKEQKVQQTAVPQ